MARSNYNINEIREVFNSETRNTSGYQLFPLAIDEDNDAADAILLRCETEE